MDIRLLLCNADEDPVRHPFASGASSAGITRTQNRPFFSSYSSSSSSTTTTTTTTTDTATTSTAPSRAPLTPPPPEAVPIDSSSSSLRIVVNDTPAEDHPRRNQHLQHQHQHLQLQWHLNQEPQYAQKSSAAALRRKPAEKFRNAMNQGRQLRTAVLSASPTPSPCTDAGPYACDDCGAQFRWRHGLRRHKLVVEKGTREFKCPHCERRFGEKGNLNKHIRHTHLRLKAFSCMICHTSFAKRDHYKRHLATIHRHVAHHLLQHSNLVSDGEVAARGTSLPSGSDPAHRSSKPVIKESSSR